MRLYGKLECTSTIHELFRVSHVVPCSPVTFNRFEDYLASNVSGQMPPCLPQVLRGLQTHHDSQAHGIPGVAG